MVLTGANRLGWLKSEAPIVGSRQQGKLANGGASSYLALTLLMLRVTADDHDATATLDDAAFFADFANRCSYFHASLARLQSFDTTTVRLGWVGLSPLGDGVKGAH